MSSFQALANLIKFKLAGRPYHASLFRVGMVLEPDPTPFILAAGAIKVADPTGGEKLVVSAVVSLKAGDVNLTRLHLGDSGKFLQLAVSDDGRVEECRYFSLVDRETPPDEDTWDVWLNPDQGLIGWPQFQTLDGQLYDRVWSPGLSRIEPIAFEAKVTAADGSHTLDTRAMLYVRTTGLAEPAPQAEYLMVAVVENGEEAWVDLHAGIDLNPAALTLA
ncbi:hypothetical protein GCM10011611_22520 [Aliidongia dinghuensis]|uniref:DUF2491 family protein n=1 Tax=Aliidongia dinghuensis TaxID=1867774 RepID=A0A8J3E349_9PROT|nr:DUF2491 family protein [Aliidongia dinghuensis]GGF16250.1 hypothetical protein GCM10011611_22520 [Aliidongia dinghuensis]